MPSPPVDANVIPLMSHSNCHTYIVEVSEDTIIILSFSKSDRNVIFIMTNMEMRYIVERMHESQKMLKVPMRY